MVDRAKLSLGKYLFRKLWKWIPGYGALEEAKASVFEVVLL